jgi:pimeloyl-ACP methyl ester carboxylesterase
MIDKSFAIDSVAVVVAVTGMMAAPMAAPSWAEDVPNAPLVIARQGSLEAGGEMVFCPTNDGGDPNSKRWPKGHVVINHVYATYQYPAVQKYRFPILFNPGGGHTARVYDTTPDGREGWLTLFLREGFATYGVDRVNTGRAGSDICRINAVKLGQAPALELPAMNRYAAESAWVTFRWGPEFGKPYPDTQFPIEAADNYYPQTVSTYRDPQELRKSVHALAALLDKVGPATLQTWSSSGLMGYLTATERPQLVKGILAVETSPTAFDEIPAAGLAKLVKVPIVVVIGDRAQDRVDASRAFQRKMRSLGGDVTVDVLPEAGIHGNGHTLMLEKNNKEIMFRMISWLKAHVYKGE